MKINRNRNFNNKGFTLAELIMAMWVIGIILAAVASLAFALGSANDSADDTAEFQSRLRFSTVKITDMIKNCKLICANGGNRIAIWRADDNGDADVNPGELVYIEYSSGKIRILEFAPYGNVADWDISIADIKNNNIRSWLLGRADWEYTDLMEASAALFTTDTSTPFSKSASIVLKIMRNGIAQRYEMTASLRCYAGHLLNSSGELVGYDDDQ